MFYHQDNHVLSVSSDYVSQKFTEEDINVKRRGRNKKRPVFKKVRTNNYCSDVFNKGECKTINCKYIHDIDKWITEFPSLDDICPNFKNFGFCNSGLNCKFYKSHFITDDNYTNAINLDIWQRKRHLFFPRNLINPKTLESLRKNSYNYNHSKQIIDKLELDNKRVTLSEHLKLVNTYDVADDYDFPEIDHKFNTYWDNQLYLAPLTTVGNLPFRRICKQLGADITCGEMSLSTSLLKGNKSEWALLRRHASEDKFGIQVCGCHLDSMTKVAQLIRDLQDTSYQISPLYLSSHNDSNEFYDECVSNFGVDFVDINMGCPLDEVCNKGAGASLMTRLDRTMTIVKGMRSMLPPSVALTLKMRTGIKDETHLVHKHIQHLATLTDGIKRIKLSLSYNDNSPNLNNDAENKNWNPVSLLTIHGRSKNQRYTRRADWSYIKSCVDLVSSEKKENFTLPIFGGGDVYTPGEYYSRLAESGVSGIMIGRAGLIKPWIFTEIKERRDWDISATERLDMFKEYVSYGLQHWGSDTYGLETTRRFLLEWMSFTHRYIPLGILEKVPSTIVETYPYLHNNNTQFNAECIKLSDEEKDIRGLANHKYIGPVTINTRTPFRHAQYGRTDLEKLLSSSDCKDWIKVTEMLLGPVPIDFTFLPKHKSNSYESNG